MRPAEDIKILIENMSDKTSARMDQRVREDMLWALEEYEKPSALTGPRIGRIIMKSPIAKVTAAAMIIAAAVLTINVWDKIAPAAYGLEQTVEANNTVRSLHIKDFTLGQDEPKEFWLVCDESGQLKSARWHMPEWDAPEDGAKVVVWKENKIQLWFKGTTKKKACLVTYTNTNGADWLYKGVQEYNPKLAVERLYEQQAQDKVNIEVNQPADKAKQILVTATYLPESPKSGRREVLFVDRISKLVTAIKFYLLKDGEYKYQGMQEFNNYNQPINPDIFDLDKEAPADVLRMDKDQQKMEINKRIDPDELEKYENITPQGMTKTFFQACADEDWDELLKFMSDSEVKQEFKDYYGGLEIISIGEPFKTEEYHGWFVPYEVRLKSGSTKKWNLAVSNRNVVQRYLYDGGLLR